VASTCPLVPCTRLFKNEHWTYYVRSEFFNQIIPKVSYKLFVLVLCLMSFCISNFGLNNIIQYTLPVLMLLYPLAIVLILLALSSSLFGHKQSIYITTMFLTFCVSFFDGYSTLVDSLPGTSVPFFESIKLFYMDNLPLYDIGLSWILPALVGAIIGSLWPRIAKNTVV
jgi:branched-chain amino acid:cation transporter, LIVCS family